MPPQTRSRGGSRPTTGRVYHSTSTPQQAQFPPRRRTLRTYGKQNRKPPARTLRQQTLTQIDFVSSSEVDKEPIVLSSDSEDHDDEEDDNDDADEDDVEVEVEDQDDDEDKENRPVQDLETRGEDQDGDEDQDDDEEEEPVSSGRKRRSTSERAMPRIKGTKRRRTLGDELKTKSKGSSRSSRRKTTGDVPSANYHTQTLTQFLGRDGSRPELINDSEDENPIHNDDGFRDWLENAESSIQRRDRRPSRSPLKVLFETRLDSSRQSSVVPQTPSRPPRDEIPSSSQVSTPASTMINRYGFPNYPDGTPSKNRSSPAAATATPTREKEATSSPLSTLRSTMINRYGPPNIMDPSPSQMKSSPIATSSTPVRLKLTGKPKPKAKNTTPRMEIQDTFATESWGTSSLTPTPLGNRAINTPSRAKTPTRESSSLADETDMDTPTKPRRRTQSAELGDTNDTQRKYSKTPKKTVPSRKEKVVLEIPDSEDEDGAFDEEDEGEYGMGLETQFIMSEMASSEEGLAKATSAPTSAPPFPAPTPSATALAGTKSSSAASAKLQRHLTSSPPPASSQPTSPALPSSPPAASRSVAKDSRPRPSPRRPLREPLHRSVPAGTHTQPFESQRVPLATLQGLPPASTRTDILLPVSPEILSLIIGGFQAQLSLAFKIPLQVVRFWLFDGELLRYMACAEAAQSQNGLWAYHLTQVYELNNPVEGDDMREEGWVEGSIGRYTYMPPAVVGQLLWNLRHALFREGSEQENLEQTREQIQEQAQGQIQEQIQGQGSSPVFGDQTQNRAPTPNLSVSQQVEAQLQSDIAHSTQFPTSDDILVPSTPEEENELTSPKTKAQAELPEPIKPPPSHLRHAPTSYRASRPSLGRTSQATTVSQASTPEKASSFYAPPPHHSSSSIVYQDLGDSSPLRLPQSVPTGSSQLLTKSQMLPDSLLRDDGRVPPEIWDSDEDRDASL